MSTELTVKLHSIATDGLPGDQVPAGAVAFIFDGCLVSGWPLDPIKMDAEGLFVDSEIREYAARRAWLWEGDSDVARHTKFGNVTHWIELPRPAWDLER